MAKKKQPSRRRKRNLAQSDEAAGLLKFATRLLSNLSPVKLPFELEQDGLLWVIGKGGGLPKAKTVAKAVAVDKLLSTFLSGVNIESFGGFAGEDWL